MNPDVFLPIAFSIMIGMFALMLIVGIPRGKRVQKTNEKMAENQARQIALHERQAAALERIASALERRGD